MKKSDVIEKVAQAAGVSKPVAGRAVDAVYACMQEALVQEGRFTIVGFGSFAVKDASARTGRNPRTGETFEVPAKKRVAFSAAQALKDKVN